MSRLMLFTVLGVLCACGGATTSETDTSDAAVNGSAVCGSLADSGLTFAQCIASRCCSEVTTCVEDPEGVPYENCVVNCTFDGGAFSADGGASCTDTCGAAHPHGASACRPYLQCVTDSCGPRH